jgi:8-oxo-dGTP pyrophosphatase MutT (NUDIX family)
VEIAKAMKAPVITCGIYLYNVNKDQLLACHATHSSWKSWSIPKGVRDEKEDNFSAAARELQEETGIDIHSVHVLYRHTLPSSRYSKQNKILESFLVITDTDLSMHKYECHTLINNEFPEIDSWKWIDLDKMEEYLHESQLKNAEEIRRRIEHYKQST